MNNNMSSTITCTKVGDNVYKISMFKGYKYIDLYKDKEYVEELIKYLQNVVNDSYPTINVDSLTDDDRKEYFEI